MGNIAPEIAAFQAAYYGEDVRQAIIDLANKLNDICEDVVVTTDVDNIIAYKSINPSDYNNLIANINIACVFVTDPSDAFTDAPDNRQYTIFVTRMSYNYNLQIAYGYGLTKKIYWRVINRNDGSEFIPWTTDSVDVDTSLSVSNAAADAATTGLYLSFKASNVNAEISQYLTVGAVLDGASKGYSSTRLGDYNTASGARSVAMGSNTIAASAEQVVEGEYNVADSNGTYAHIIGNGTGENDRSNAATVDWSGNAWFAGTVKVGSGEKELATKEYVDAAIGSAIGGSY